ncbi:endonuclease MutS2 isoform X2 [Tripterygium wilfordii]|uniref:endonuclease MutS2 isoform X2 n=1 Tax=Tripterygium wilfordii TaxID=458696 RepID=UPI0018F82037|nr:endonuclease MutS2 isoform X2 [Tripterygium wilfordii]
MAVALSTKLSFVSPESIIYSKDRDRSRRRRTTVSFKSQVFHGQSLHFAPPPHKSKVHCDSLRVLEWGKLCESVASFAGTSLGHEATKAQLWSLHQTFQDSLRLLDETNAAVEMHKHGACRLDFAALNLALVESSIQRARRGSPVDSNEAMAVVALLESVHDLQLNLKASIKQDADWYKRFMPLTEMIIEPVVNRSLIKLIHQVIDEDGMIKDSASSSLARSRNQVRMLEEKIHLLMNRLISVEMNEAPFLEVSNVAGRWCIKSADDHLTILKGLLLSSGLGTGNTVEPLSAVPLNDELQRARALVAKAEEDVLLMLTEKMQSDLDDIEKTLNSVVQLDVINARARYSLSFGGTSPNIYLPEDNEEFLSAEVYLSGNKTSKTSYTVKKECKLCLSKCYHPLLVQQHRQLLEKAQKKGSKASAVTPVPFDFFVDQKTRVLVVTGPNTGGKTICLKTVGLAAMMAKSGLHILSSESVQIPWFDYVFADIGDEQSSQSLSTFSGHLKQISDIRSHSTDQSLVLLDEVGAGTNPLEGAALGMSVLESFAESGALLTIATTHHGELKSLKYSDDAFENACMEFDEESLTPTYNILWGVPGRSNAINISAKLGLPSIIVSTARTLYGTTSEEINEVISDMEIFKQQFQELILEGRHHLMLSRDLHEKLLFAKRKVLGHGTDQRYAKMREISEAASIARSTLHRKLWQLRASARNITCQSALASDHQFITADNSEHPTETQSSSTSEYTRQLPSACKSQGTLASDHLCTATDNSEHPTETESSTTSKVTIQSPQVERADLPKVGDMVHVSSLGKTVTVLRVEPSKREIVVQVGNMKLKFNLANVNCEELNGQKKLILMLPRQE